MERKIMRVNYEEKVFENYFNSELRDYTKMVFSPGQCLEGLLGFDFMAYISCKHLNEIFGINQDLSGIPKKVLEKRLGASLDRIPNITANIFLQYKKPEYLTNSNASEWRHWEEKYFRYNIYSEQQEILKKLSETIGDKGVVLYASPAIKDVQELYDKYSDKKLIKNVNFQLASKLTGHHRNTYISAGQCSIACSKPQQIKNFDFINFLNSLNDYGTINSLSNKEFIIETAEKISNKFEKLTSNFIVERNEKFKVSESFYIITEFCKYYSLDWKLKTQVIYNDLD